MLAVIRNHPAIVDFLVSVGANKMIKDANDKVPSDYLLDDMQEIAVLFPDREIRSKVAVPGLAVAATRHEETVRSVVDQQQLSPRTQTLFSGLGDGVPLQNFVKHLESLPSDRVNAQNIGKRGDTPLMLLLRNKSLSPLKQTKAKALIQHGALWQATNRRGETPEQLLAQHPERERLNSFLKP